MIVRKGRPTRDLAQLHRVSPALLRKKEPSGLHRARRAPFQNPYTSGACAKAYENGIGTPMPRAAGYLGARSVIYGLCERRVGQSRTYLLSLQRPARRLSLLLGSHEPTTLCTHASCQTTLSSDVREASREHVTHQPQRRVAQCDWQAALHVDGHALYRLLLATRQVESVSTDERLTRIIIQSMTAFCRRLLSASLQSSHASFAASECMVVSMTRG